MLNNNFARTSAAIARANMPDITPQRQIDLVEALRQGANDYYTYDAIRRNNDEQDRIRGLEQNLAEALAGGNEQEISNAYAQLNPTGYMDYLNKIKANREAADLEFARQKELLDIQNQNAMGLARFRSQFQAPEMTSAARNYEYLKSQGLSDNQAMAVAFGGNTEAVGGALASGTLSGKGLNAYDTTMGKSLAEKESARQDFESLKPSAFDAIRRAEKALEDGSGLGAIQGRLGDIGIASEKGAMNQADIRAANSQMNAILRQKLAATGLTGSELNSALEAQAYRYTIDPSMPISYIRQQIRNFKNDYLSDKGLDMSDPRIKAAKEAGYTDVEIREYLRGKNG